MLLNMTPNRYNSLCCNNSGEKTELWVDNKQENKPQGGFKRATACSDLTLCGTSAQPRQHQRYTGAQHLNVFFLLEFTENIHRMLVYFH